MPFYLCVGASNRQNIFNQTETTIQISILVTIILSNLYVLSQFIMLLTWVYLVSMYYWFESIKLFSLKKKKISFANNF